MEPLLPFVLLGIAVGLLIWGVSNLSGEGRYTNLFATGATAAGLAVLAWFFTAQGKDDRQYVVIAGILLVGMVFWGLIDPVVGRRLARIFAVIAMGLGTGVLVWGIIGAATGERLRPPFGSNLITEVSEAFAWAAGLLTGGILALVFSFIGRTRNPGRHDPRESEPISESTHHPV
jgi:hypothetical protein